MEKKMNRRNLLQSFSVLPFLGNRKIRLDRISKLTSTDWTMYRSAYYNGFEYIGTEFFEPEVLKDIIKNSDEVTLEDGNKNVLKVNKLNKGLVLLKLDLIK